LACRRSALEFAGITSLASYICPDEIESELSKSYEPLPYLIRKKGEAPLFTGFAMANYRGVAKKKIKGKLFKQMVKVEELYQGDYKNGKPNGEGKWVFTDGGTFIGRFEDGVHAEGAYFYPNGDVFVGSFING
jgi:hypothetical protein